MTDTPTFRPLTRLATVVQIFLAGHVAVGLLGLVPESMWETPEGVEQSMLELGLTVFFGLGLIALLIAVVVGTIVTFLMWMNRAAHNLRALLPGAAFEFTPGWCVGWWFVPFANLVKPLHAMNEIAKASSAAAMKDEKDPYASSWMTAAVPPVIGAWWALWIISNVIDRVSMRMDSFGINLVAAVVGGFAAAACMMVIREVTTLQDEAFARAKTARFSEATSHVVG